MAIEIGGPKNDKVKPAMNITPLVDIVLVLLIIFMTVAPSLVKQFYVQIPKHEEKKAEAADDKNKPVVLKVKKDGTLEITGNPIAKTELREKLKRVLAAKNGDHTVFFIADEEAPYGAAVEAMDIARAGGAAPLTVLTEKPKT